MAEVVFFFLFHAPGYEYAGLIWIQVLMLPAISTTTICDISVYVYNIWTYLKWQTWQTKS